MAEAMEEAPSFTGSCLASVFMEPRTSWVEIVLPTVDWDLLHQCSKQSPRHAPWANQIWAIPQLRFPSQVIPGLSVKLTVKTR